MSQRLEGKSSNPLERFGSNAAYTIFQIIRSSGPLSQAKIAERTNLSKSTVSLYIENLARMGLIEEEALPPSSTKKRRKIRLAETAGYLIGIDLGSSSLDIALCNLDSTILESYSLPLCMASGPKVILEEARVAIDRLCATRNIPRNSLFGIGMGLPASVEFSTGTPISRPIPSGWDGYPVRAELQKHFPCAVFIDNDANVMALGERLKGIGREVENFLFVKAGTGIGVGLILRGQLYRGYTSCAGEMGHIWIDGEDVPCVCGNRGCLEQIAGGAAIARKGSAAAQDGSSEYLKERLRSSGEITAVDIGQAAMHGDQAAMSIVIDSGRKIGNVLAKMVNFINPSLIVIGGGLANLGDRFISTIREVVYSRSLPLATSELAIRRSALMGKAGVIGAATMVLDEALSWKTEKARIAASV